MKRLAILLLLLPTFASAQEIGTPSQIALQINGAVAQIAQRAEYAERRVVQLTAQMAELEKQLAAAKKEEPKRPEPKN